MQKCEQNDCTRSINSADPKRIYTYDEVLEDEVAIAVCDEHYKEHIQEENDIDWDEAIDSIIEE